MERTLSEQTALYWIRNDQRLDDNAALRAACKHRTVIIAYIFDAFNFEQWSIGGAAKWWLHQSLEALDSSLQNLGNQIRYFKGDPTEVLLTCVKERSGCD